MPVQIGLRDVYYALLTTDTTAVLSYQDPVLISGAIQANINPNSSLETLFADDGPMETASSLGQITLELMVADLPLDVQAVILGHTAIDGAGVLRRMAGDVPPWIAIGFRSLKSDGEYRYVWLVKGKFQLPELNHETKGDTVSFQTPSMTGSFVKREHDDCWIMQADEATPAFNPLTWFTAVVLAS